jgi:hypothetical protein
MIDLPQTWRRLAAGWQAPLPPAAVASPGAGAREIETDIEFNWAGEEARLAGRLVHRLLQRIGESGLEVWQEDGDWGPATVWCHQYLWRRGVRGEMAETIIARAREAVETTVASTTGRWILSAHEDAHCEYALTVARIGQARKLVLDRTFVSSGERWIIDYKTSSHTGGSLEDFLDNEVRRHGEQLRVYRNALALTETLPIRAALYFPLLDRMVEVE